MTKEELADTLKWMRQRRVRADANPYNARVLRLVALDGDPETRWVDHLSGDQEAAVLAEAVEITNERSW